MPGAELDLAYLGGLVALVLLGPGLLSIDERIGLEPRATIGQPRPTPINAAP